MPGTQEGTFAKLCKCNYTTAYEAYMKERMTHSVDLTIYEIHAAIDLVLKPLGWTSTELYKEGWELEEKECRYLK